MIADVRDLWDRRAVHGVELLFDTVLLLLRYASVSYWMKRLFLPGPADSDHAPRDNAVDAYCIVQLVVLLLLALTGGFGRGWNSFVAGYILFEIYLNLFNIVFVGKFRTISAPPASVERSIYLLLLNVFDVVLAFTVLYRDWLDLPTVTAFFNAVLVLGTVGHPVTSGWRVLLVATQIVLDLALVVLVLSSFAGRIGLFPPAIASPEATASNKPLQRPEARDARPGR